MAVKELIGKVNNRKLDIKNRAKACGLLKVADSLDKDQLVPLKEAYFIYRNEVRRELLFNFLSSDISSETAEKILLYFDSIDGHDSTNCQEYLDEQTVEMCRIFLSKLPTMNYHSGTARDMFMNHLPVVLAYKQTDNFNIHSCLIKRFSGVNWANLIQMNWLGKETMLREEVASRIQSLIPEALEYASERDRHVFKLVLYRLTSKIFLVEKGLGKKFSGKYLSHIINQTENALEKWINSSEQEKKKIKLRGNRLSGSGRIPLAKMYPQLANLMLNIFDSNEGLQSHPRLVCETLYLHNNVSMNMPRCVSILEQVSGIDMSLSCAYSYTDNFRSKTHQAKRHHEGKGLNPGISLHKPTRDGFSKELSVNDHFAQADVNFSIEQALENEAVIIARDDKALVHCDVEVVQRPSKSWRKISYADHDWQKDTQRSLQITTYQFVKLKEKKMDVDCIILDDTPVCQTNLTGPGLSLVKEHFNEGSTVFRHLNELLFVMSEEKFKTHFTKTDGRFISQVLLTVDGGPDERPRNKTTQFACTLLKQLLNLDKVKTISYAEGSSKRHSVERYVVEGKALSQKGTVSSKGIHAEEIDECGLFDAKKFDENMEFAREDCISRINGTPYAGSVITALKPPTE